jgi:hypothetical protein
VSTLAPTIFVVLGTSTLTLAYMDNDLIQKSGVPNTDVYTHADSNLSMKGKFAKAMISKTLPREFVVELPVPTIPDLAEEDISRLAVARVRELLR